ncbi:Hypothetical_protein [Hexamita inflata]|uniref:Hypothetical_protein n=1 Tax=Hexamita inflata TaxID=28002 RepID=A0AA86PXQ5_9EUKA|nr:Hypothetical protein HINF_LOCUS35930 [Hexamita inflata]
MIVLSILTNIFQLNQVKSTLCHVSSSSLMWLQLSEFSFFSFFLLFVLTGTVLLIARNSFESGLSGYRTRVFRRLRCGLTRQWIYAFSICLLVSGVGLDETDALQCIFARKVNKVFQTNMEQF